MGADINAKNKQGNTCLTEMTVRTATTIDSATRDSIEDYLLESKADVNACNNKEAISLMFAIMNGCPSFTKKLIDNGASVNARTDMGKTPLMISADGTTASGRGDTIQYIIDHKADLDAKNFDERTALDYAVERNNYSVIKALFTAGAYMDSPSIQPYIDNTVPIDDLDDETTSSLLITERQRRITRTLSQTTIVVSGSGTAATQPLIPLPVAGGHIALYHIIS